MKLLHKYIFIGAMLSVVACSEDTGTTFEPDAGVMELNGSIETRADAHIPFRLYAMPEASAAWTGFYVNTIARLTPDNKITTDNNYYWPAWEEPEMRIIGAMTAGDAGAATSTTDVNATGLMQLTSGKGAGYDYLAANTTISKAAQVPVAFNHLMAQVKVEINLDPGINKPGENPLVSFELGSKSALYNLLGKSYSDVSPTLYKVDIQSDGGEEIHYLIPGGQEITGLKNFTVHSQSYGELDITNLDGGDPLKLTAGESYTLKITLEPMGLVSATCELSPWDAETLPDPVAVARMLAIECTKNGALYTDYDKHITRIEMKDNTNNLFVANAGVDSDGNLSTGGLEILPASIDELSLYFGDKKAVIPSGRWGYNQTSGILDIDLGDTSDSKNPFLVATPAALQAINDEIDKKESQYYLQICDIDLAGIDWKPIGKGESEFKGEYNGAGHQIENLSLKGNEDVGLFGVVIGNLINIHLVSCQVEGTNKVGGIAGRLTVESFVENSSVSGYVSGLLYVGGICGSINGSSGVRKSRNTSTVHGGDFVGGICGESANEVSNSYNTGEVYATFYSGGICGKLDSNGNSLKTCYNTGVVQSDNKYEGGICGLVERGGSEDCYWTARSASQAAGQSNTSPLGAEKFSDVSWPKWHPVSGWKDLGAWDENRPVYPKLDWE